MSADLPPPDLREKGRLKDGTVVYSERRLWMQFQAFTDCRGTDSLVESLAAADVPMVLYNDWTDPWGVGLLRWSEDPAYFTRAGRDWLQSSPFSELTPREELTMAGRTYAVGYESNLDEVLVDRPQNRVLDPNFPWAVWYPVKRARAFESLPEEEKHAVLMNHGSIGMGYGKAGLAHDIRLACHGLDVHDNDFIIGILAPELVNASAVVQAMRKSLQTMHHLDDLGPFFTGHVLARTSGA